MGGGGGFDTWAHREEKGNSWLVAGRFTTEFKFKKVIKAKKALQNTRLYSGFKKPNKKNPRNGKTQVDLS